jgi:hypothetical protein
MSSPDRPSRQAVGAYGEKVVEAELLRRSWIASNVNASVRNAAEFDVIAQKDGRVALLRVKASVLVKMGSSSRCRLAKGSTSEACGQMT